MTPFTNPNKAYLETLQHTGGNLLTGLSAEVANGDISIQLRKPRYSYISTGLSYILWTQEELCFTISVKVHILNKVDTDLAAEILQRDEFGIEDSHRLDSSEYNVLG